MEALPARAARPTNGTTLSEKRFRTETGWDPGWLAGRVVLDAGCGAGRFLEVASRDAGLVFGLDYSESIDAARVSLADRDNIELVQADIYALPFRRGSLDGWYCIGVIQHTPDPERALAQIPPLVAPGGRFALTAYERRRFTLLSGKYLARRIFRRLSATAKLRLIRLTLPVLFPLTAVLFRLLVLRRAFRFVLPIANYVDDPQLSRTPALAGRSSTPSTCSPPCTTRPSGKAISGALAAGGIERVTRYRTSDSTSSANGPRLRPGSTRRRSRRAVPSITATDPRYATPPAPHVMRSCNRSDPAKRAPSAATPKAPSALIATTA